MSESPLAMVRAWHEKYGQPVRTVPQREGVVVDEKKLRERLMLEEAAELVCALYGYEDAPALAEAFDRAVYEHAATRCPAGVTRRSDRGELVEVADALADLLYVTYGTALHYGIDLDAVLAEVHRSNMTKTYDPSRAKYAGKVVVKGEEFEPARIAETLGAAA